MKVKNRDKIFYIIILFHFVKSIISRGNKRNNLNLNDNDNENFIQNG